jgi:TonB family protein
MTDLFIYLLKAAAINAIILAFYYFALRQSNRFILMRYVLVTAMLFPLLIPLIPYPVQTQQESTYLPVFTITIPETTIAATSTGQNLFNLTDMPAFIYYGISLVLLIGMIISVIAIIQKRLRSKQHYTALGKVELENSVKSPFSFFSWVFLAPTDLTHPQLDMILKHEFCHVREKHSIDRVLSGIFRSVLWFSPFAHITSRLLSEVHEYQADSKVIGVYDRIDYSDLILSFYLNPQSSAITNNFSLHTKKRIKMINNLNFRKLNYSRILTALSLSLFLVFLTSMVTKTEDLAVIVSTGDNSSFNTPIVEVQNSDTVPPYPDATPWFIELYKDEKSHFKGHSGKVIIGLLVEADGTAKDIRVVQSAGEYLDNWSLNKIKEVKKWYPAMVDDKPVSYQLYYPFSFVGEDKLELAGTLAFNPDTVLKAHQKENNGKDLPDSPPQFPGGDKARTDYIIANTSYPEDARKAGIEGTVYVKFTITPTGEITNVQILKGVHPSLDRVANSAIQNMPKWIPARKDNQPVSYEMTMPIKFSLSDGKDGKVVKDPGAGDKFTKDLPVPHKPEGSRVYSVVEETPEYPGGDEARMEYFKNNVKYPEEARKQGIEGTVYITFVVEPDGSITNEQVLRGIGGGLDEIALEVVKNMPKWKPGKVKGEPVPVQFNMPIKFSLSAGQEGKVAKEASAGDPFSKDILKPHKPEGSRVFTVAEETPEYPGGDKARIEYLQKNIAYPAEAIKKGIEGTVYITFVVEPDGSITEEKVLRGIGGGLDEIALEVVKNMPKWKPGKVKGEPVPVQFNMPIRFSLEKAKKKNK